VKTQIIQLSSRDDTISVQEKMSWSQAGRILLVWPESGHVLDQQLDLTLLLRKATSLGAQLVLISHDLKVRFYAKQLGIEVAQNPGQALAAKENIATHKGFAARKAISRSELELLHQKTLQRSSPWMENPATRIVCLSLSVLALFVLGIVILPGAKIILSPRLEGQSMVFNLVADPTSKSINFAAGSLPTFTREVIVEGHGMAVPTGQVNISDKPAMGTVLFTNQTDQTINIPAETIISTSGSKPVRFITTSPDEQRLDQHQSASLDARAILPGPSGNLAADELVIVEGQLGNVLSVTNPEAMIGGHDAIVLATTQKDVDSLQQRLLSQLIRDALGELQSSLQKDDLLITPTITNVETLAEDYFPGVGEPGNQLELSMKIKVQAQIVSGETIHTFCNTIMDSYTPQGFTPLGNSLLISPQNNLAAGADGKAHLAITATRQLKAVIPSEKAAQMIAGRTIQLAIQRLSSSLPLSEQASITISPPWWPRLPFLPMRIELVQQDLQ
jgi:hypothetical protein